MSTIASEIARSNDVFIKHNFNNHDGEVPVWAIVEVLSFGTLSKIIKNLKTGTGSSYSVLPLKIKVQIYLDELSDNNKSTKEKRELKSKLFEIFNNLIHEEV